MTNKRGNGKKKKLTKAELDRLGPEWLNEVFETWSQYHDRTGWLLYNNGSEQEIEENRDKATMYYEAWLDLMLSLKKRNEL